MVYKFLNKNTYEKNSCYFRRYSIDRVMAATIFLQKGTSLRGYLKAALPTHLHFYWSRCCSSSWNIDANCLAEEFQQLKTR